MIEAHKTTIRRLTQAAWNQGDLDALTELYSADVVRHKPPFPALFGLAAVRGYTAKTRSNYSDVQLTIDEVTCEENTMMLRWTFQATRTELSPTTDAAGSGKPIAFTGCSISHWLDGKIAEEWEYADYLALQQQMGVLS